MVVTSLPWGSAARVRQASTGARPPGRARAAVALVTALLGAGRRLVAEHRGASSGRGRRLSRSSLTSRVRRASLHCPDRRRAIPQIRSGRPLLPSNGREGGLFPPLREQQLFVVCARLGTDGGHRQQRAAFARGYGPEAPSHRRARRRNAMRLESRPRPRSSNVAVNSPRRPRARPPRRPLGRAPGPPRLRGERHDGGGRKPAVRASPALRAREGRAVVGPPYTVHRTAINPPRSRRGGRPPERGRASSAERRPASEMLGDHRGLVVDQARSTAPRRRAASKAPSRLSRSARRQEVFRRRGSEPPMDQEGVVPLELGRRVDPTATAPASSSSSRLPSRSA